MRHEPSQQTYSIFRQIIAAFSHPGNMARLTALSEFNRLKSLGKKAVRHIEAPYKGQKILMMALFQKGTLRKDVRFILRAAREKGYYVIAVNSLKLRDPSEMADVCDLYTERYNFGRDFGSFQWGFKHLFDQNLAKTCPRLLMINDSVFFNSARVPAFLDDMMSSPIEALGATENYEINHHLGSFCIAMSGNILRHAKFQKYWRNYWLSDVRPTVIKRGEMGLSKVLKKCVTSSDQFQALYDSARYSTLLEGLSQDQLEDIVSLMRRCQLTRSRFSLVKTLETIEEDLSLNFLEDVQLQIGSDAISEVTGSRVAVSNIEELISAVNSRLVGQNRIDPKRLLTLVKSELVDNFRQHSQIHQNSAVLLHMGLPIVKLDCLYRGMLNTLDVNKVLSFLPHDEKEELRRLLYARPFGGDVLFGWKRSAFMRGLI